MFLTDTEHPDIIPEDNEHVLRNHNILDETDYSFLMHFWSEHQTVCSVLVKCLWMYAEQIISIQKTPEEVFFFNFFSNLQMEEKYSSSYLKPEHKE